jgi:hypothetical protein
VWLCAFGLLAGTVVGSAEARSEDARRTIVKVRHIAPGLTFTRIIEKKIPRRTFVLRVDLSERVTFDVDLAAPELPASARTSQMARRADALAAVNGDFGSVVRPTHPFAEDGELLQGSGVGNPTFAVSTDEQRVFMGTARPTVTVSDPASSRTWVIDRWNRGAPDLGEIAGFSPPIGTLESPPEFACSVRLQPSGPPVLADPDGVDRPYVVDQAGCSDAPLERSGGVVLSAVPATDEAVALLSLVPDQTVTLHWTLGWPGVLDAIGGMPMLVADGEIVVDPGCRGGLCGPNPRTGIGVTANGRLLLVVVDGRRERWSKGPTFFGFARIMRSQGAVWAMNLDGGGSSTMVVEGEVVNRPSDGNERRVSNAVLVLPGPDPGEAR